MQDRGQDSNNTIYEVAHETVEAKSKPSNNIGNQLRAMQETNTQGKHESNTVAYSID